MAPQVSSLFLNPLEPVRGGPSEAMSASQRGRMLDAVTRAVAKKGYADVTVADVVRIAGVSRRTFYERFTDKQDCFLEAYEAGTKALLGGMAAAVRDLGEDPHWRDILEVAVGNYLGTLAEHPDFARTFLIDVLGAGPVAVERRRGVYGQFVDQYRFLAARTAEQEPELAELPDVYLKALVGGISELVQGHILERGAASLMELAPVLIQLVVAVLQGAGGQAPPRGRPA
ncbi:MAG: TetR/AcrR family transcriptional regulator [Thermoleophilaceae bacterium]